MKPGDGSGSCHGAGSCLAMGEARPGQSGAVSVWHSGLEVSSYSWSKQQLGQGAEIVTGAERLPGERSDLGIPSEDPGPVFFLSTPSFFFFFFPRFGL